MTGPFDIAVIGGGPAGAQAAFKAALLHKSCVWFDRGRRYSRIYWSHRVDNLPGRFGESGRAIVDQGYSGIEEYEQDQGKRFVTVHEDTEVTFVSQKDGIYRITARSGEEELKASAKVLVLATGAIDRQPQLRAFRKRDIEAILPYANKGLADYCLLCDGHTVSGKRVAVIGCSPSVRSIAKSLKKNFGADTVLVPMCNTGQRPADTEETPDWDEVEADLARWQIPLLYGQVASFSGIKDGRFKIHFEDGSDETFDKAWIAMGWYKVNSELAVGLGAALDGEGFVSTDEEGRVFDTDGRIIEGLYAIGDLRSGSWKQIPIAWGDAERAVIDAFVSHL